MLPLTSLQREGKKVENPLSILGTLSRGVVKLKSQCGQCEKDIKALKIGGPLEKSSMLFLLPASFLALDHKYVCYMTSHVKFC
jgi:hypothetical protein